jgi:hypothetical protein
MPMPAAPTLPVTNPRSSNEMKSSQNITAKYRI